MYGEDSPFHQAMTQRLLRFIDPQPEQMALDVGCGFGRLSIALLQAGCRVTGVDISQPSLDQLSQRVRCLDLADRFEARCQPLQKITEKARYHLLCGRGILHHLEHPVAALAKLRATLVPGGRAVFMDPNPLNPAWVPFILFHPTLSWSLERHYLRGTPRHSHKMLQQAGFEKIEHRFIGMLPPPLWGRFSQMTKLEDKLTSLPALRALSMYIIISGTR